MPFLENLYLRLPVPVQTAIITGVGAAKRTSRFGVHYQRHIRQLRKSDEWDKRRLYEYQTRELGRLLTEAWKHVDYYRQRWPKSPSGKAPWDYLANLPYLSKADIRDHGGDSLLSKVYFKPLLIKISTSGTTGSPTQLFIDRRSRQENYSYFTRLLEWNGVERTGWHAVFSGRVLGSHEQMTHQPWRKDLANRAVFFSSFHIGPGSVERYARGLSLRRLQWIEGYPSALTALARLIIERQVAVLPPRLIILTSEAVSMKQKELITSAFRAPVVETYGAAEQAASILECPQGALHVQMEYGVVEFAPVCEDDDRQTLYEIVATSFRNRAMPLVRYRTGDLVKISKSSCRCGRASPIVNEIIGRKYDLIFTADGRAITGLGPALKGLPIRQCQFVQTTPTTLEIHLVRGRGWKDSDERRLLQSVRSRIGAGFALKVRTYDNELPYAKDKKYRPTVNAMNSDENSDLTRT